MNTWFYKKSEYLITYKDDKAHPGVPPYDSRKYDTLDYILIKDRWKNVVNDTYSDTQAGINSDHYPLISRIHVRLKAQYKKERNDQKLEFEPCTDEQRVKYHDELRANIDSARMGHLALGSWLHKSS